MNDIEQKALALLNAVAGTERYVDLYEEINEHYMKEALCRAIERHEAFRQEVSDAILRYLGPTYVPTGLKGFIIAKPDPLVAALEGVTFDHYPPNDAKTIRAALNAAGFEIREKNDD